METDELYGIECDNLETAREIIEQLLDVKLVAHESLYYGGDYYYGVMQEESYTLQWNFDLIDGELAEADFKEWGILLYVEGTLRPQELEAILGKGRVKIVLLRRDHY